MEFLSQAAITAAAVVLLVQQIMKLKVVPAKFARKYPVPTNIVLSIIATLFIVPVEWSLDSLPQLAVQVGTVAVVAAVAYNQLLETWVKQYEGKKQ
jgi:uncharacterized membrane protein